MKLFDCQLSKNPSSLNTFLFDTLRISMRYQWEQYTHRIELCRN